LPGRAAFTLIEIMVVVVLLAVIVIGLMAMFNQTQRAFRAGMAQTDILEAGRMFTDLLVRDVEQMTPSYQTNAVNFYVDIPNYSPEQVVLPANGGVPRTNVLEDMFFLTRYNQTWKAVGYYVRSSTNAGYGGYIENAGSLYRFETNMSILQFNGNPSLPFRTYLNATNFPGPAAIPAANVAKVLDGVVEFRVHCYDTNGVLLDGNSFVSNNFVMIRNSTTSYPGEVGLYAFSNNIVPAFVEVQLGVLEPAVLKKYNSIPDPVTRSNFLASHAGNVQLFRERISIRNVDPSAYQLQQ
jgi:prepilin-type N-terminal cleavage/methylation domain-containing protein